MLSEIFKAYDVRGIYGKNLTEGIAYKIGRAFVYFLKCREVIVGTDMRVSSPKLSKAFMNGVIEQGSDAVFIGEVCSDAVYFASGFLNKPAVMFTASHNPPQYNGMKFCRSGAIPINEDTGLKKIKWIIDKNKYQNFSLKEKNFGRIIKRDILKEYVRHVKGFIDVKKLRKLKIVVDAGNGMAGKIIPMVYKNIPVMIVPLYFRLDGTFPNHPADPSKYENIVKLQEAVKNGKCDFGMAFDGDADRIFFVDENGDVVNSSIISALIIKNLLMGRFMKKDIRKAGRKNEKVIYNAVCGHIVPETIKQYKGIPIIERVGHSFIKETMRRTNALFACEHSAHYYYRDNYRADSGIITSLIVSEIVSMESKPLSVLLEQFRKYITMEETSIEVGNNNKNAKLNQVEAAYERQSPKKISRLDGITMEFDDWWFNVRPSNTEPLLRLNLEAKTKEMMERKKREMIRLLKISDSYVYFCEPCHTVAKEKLI